MRFRLLPEVDFAAVWAEMVATATDTARALVERESPAACAGLSLAIVAAVLIVCATADKFGTPDPLTDPTPWED